MARYAKENNRETNKQSAAAVKTHETYDTDYCYSTILAAVKPNDAAAHVNITIQGKLFRTLCDTGSNKCYISPDAAKRTNLTLLPHKGKVTMAAADLTVQLSKKIIADFYINGRLYTGVTFYVMKDLCADIILGQNFFASHSTVHFNFGGPEPALNLVDTSTDVCGLSVMNIVPPKLFENLMSECRPIATKSRKFSDADKEFIGKTVTNLINNDKIESSTSPWRSQVLVTDDDGVHKRRMVVNYSQTINRFTELDAYPMPNIEEMIRTIAQYNHFSTLDLKSACHQIPLAESERPDTAFEANWQTLPVQSGAIWCYEWCSKMSKDNGSCD